MYNESKVYRHIGPVSPEKLTDLDNQKMVYFSLVSIALVLQQYSSMFYWELVAPLLYVCLATLPLTFNGMAWTFCTSVNLQSRDQWQQIFDRPQFPKSDSISHFLWTLYVDLHSAITANILKWWKLVFRLSFIAVFLGFSFSWAL